MEQNKRAETILIVIKRIAKWLLLSILGLVVLALLGGLGLYLYDKWESRPEVVSKLKGIALGDELNDVLFKNPNLKLVVKDKKDKTQKNFISYESEEDRISISFLDGKVDYVTYGCGKDYDYTSVNGIVCNDTSENIEDKYGEKIRVLCMVKFKTAARSYDIVEYGIRYALIYNKVVRFSIAKPERLKTFVGNTFGYCD